MPARYVRRSRIYEQIVLQLQQEILSGRTLPGTRLPTERELATQFGVSRASIREALSVLQSRGLVETRQGGGTIVRASSGTTLLGTLNDQLAEPNANITNPLEIRSMFEPQIAHLAAMRATNAEIGVMADWLHRQEEVVAAGSTGIDEDTAFHFAIARGAHNELILVIIRHINDALRETREWSLRARTGAQRSIQQHHSILTAIAAHDAEAAEAAMAAHLQEVQVLAMRWLRERVEAAQQGPDPDVTAAANRPLHGLAHDA